MFLESQNGFMVFNHVGISVLFDCYNLINEEEPNIQILYISSDLSQIHDLIIGFIKTCLD